MKPALGVIGGSGLYEIEDLEVVTTHTIKTPFGSPSDEIIEGKLNGIPIFFLPRHGKGHRLLAHEINHRANIWALRSLGVRFALSITAVGSLRQKIAPRHVVVPDQMIDRTGRAHQQTFFGQGIAAHVSFAEPYSENMRKLVSTAAAAHTPDLHTKGTYVCMNGPAFSTRAESNMHRTLGFDLIGMTNAHEARLCREAEIALATLCLVTDYDCWKTDEAAVDVSSVIENLHANSSLAKQIVQSLAPTIPATADWPEHSALQYAILTPKELWPPDTEEKLAPILSNL